MRRPLHLFLAAAVLAAAGFLLARAAIGPLSPRPAGLGVVDGRLTPCPVTPNCVSTQADPADRVHRVEPLAYTGSTADARAAVVAVLRAMPRTTIRADRPDYLHAEVRSFLWGFIDDLEFYFDGAAGLVHIRSASRLGEGDLGVNRGRYEAIRRAFAP